jgi:hypothetical protein
MRSGHFRPGTTIADLTGMDANTHFTASDSPDGLCYLSAENVERPGGTFEDVQLCNLDHESVGTVDGVLIDPAGRRVRYLVVNVRPIEDRYLVPVDEILRVESDDEGARLETTANVRLLRFNPRDVRPFSGDDAITAMFASTAA